jgi:carbon-monoxide dehydrogenase medium subunit
MVALGAKFHITGASGERTVDAANFFTDLFETALGEDELLTAVSVPKEGKGMVSAYVKMFNPASRYAVVGCAVSLTMQGNQCSAASVAIGSLTPKATACPSVANALAGNKLDDDAIAAAATAVANDLGDDILGDIHASADYRKQMAPVFVKRALIKAKDRA